MALVISDWRHETPVIRINGKILKPGSFRSGIVDNGSEQSLIIWLDYTATKEFTLEIAGTQN